MTNRVTQKVASVARGFTLIELLVVISIIGMLASTVLAALSGARQRAVIGSAQEFDSALYHSWGADQVAGFSLDSYPPVDTSINGSSASNPSLSLCSGASLDSNGINGGALKLDPAVDQYASCYNSSFPLNSVNGFNANNGSVAFWIKINTPILSQTNIMSLGGIWISINSNQQIIMSSPITLASTASLTPGQWTNVLISWNNPTGGTASTNIYINGKPSGTVSGSGLIPSFTNSPYVVLGGLAAAGRPVFNGSLDQVAIYNHSMQQP